MKQKQSSPNTVVSSLSFLLGISMGIIPLSAQGALDQNCARDPNRMNMVVELTQSGQTKMSKVAYEATRRSMDDFMKKVPSDIPEFGSVPDECKRPNIDHLSPKKMSDDCFGFLPEAIWWGDKLPNARWDRLEPVVFKMNKLQIKHVALGKKPTISCQNNVCDVSTTIDQLDLGFDISVRSVNDKTCDAFALNGVKLGLNPRALRKNPMKVRIKFRYTEDVKHPVEVLMDESSFNIPASAVEYDPKSVTQGKNLCKMLPHIQNDTAGIVDDVVAKNQHTMDQIRDALKTQFLDQFVKDQTKQLAQIDGLGSDRLMRAGIPNIKEVTSTSALKSATQDQVNVADKYLNTIMSARSGIELANALQTNLPLTSVSEYTSSFKSSKSATTLDMAQALSEKWSSNANEISRLATKSADPTIKSLLMREIDKIRLAKNHLDQFQHNVKIDLQMPTDGEPIALVLTAIQANNLQSEIQAKLSACYSCRKLGIQATGGAEWGFDKGNHDVAIKTGYGTINQFLSVMQNNHSLDTCIIEGVKRDCQDARPGDVKIDVHFPNAPEVVWNPDTRSFAFKVQGIQLRNQKGTLGKIAKTMQADVFLPGNLVLGEDGKSLRFSPIADKIKVSNPDFSAADWDRTKILSGIVAWAAEKVADTSISHGMIKSALTLDFDMPEAATLTEVKATSEGFGVYIKLPDDPTTLLPAEKPARTLAGSKNKLK